MCYERLKKRNERPKTRRERLETRYMPRNGAFWRQSLANDSLPYTSQIIIQSGIKEVVYLSDKYHDSEQCQASRIMFDMSGVTTRQHVPKEQKVVIDFGSEGR